MEFEHLFNGSALTAVDAKGRLSVPAFIRGVIERRSGTKAAFIGMQEGAPCLNAYDSTYSKALHLENERLRLAEAAENPGAALSRNRRAFSFTEEVPYDTSGRIILPPLLRRRGRIEDLALFLGVGATFEIWNPRLAIESGDPDLAELATYRLEEKGIAL